MDRRRPFRRIDNDDFLPKRVLDGDGAACGCKIEKDLGDLEAKLDQFVKDTKESVLGKTLNTVIEVVRAVLNPNRLADLLLEFIKEKLGDVAAAILTVPIKAAGGALGFLLTPVTVISEAVIGAIDNALKAFLKKFGRELLRRANRVLPQWVPVELGLSNNSVDRPQVIEVEGLCVRSFGNPVDVPFINWHTWFSWNVQVKLEKEYEKARSPSGDPPNTSGMQAGERSIIVPGSFEVQWDAGALFGAAERDRYKTKIKDTDTPSVDGPMTLDGNLATKPDIGSELDTAFLWPMPGMFVWASGRHVYDCSRVTHKASADKKKGDVEATPPRMAAMINPARALATARFQGFVFPENGNFAVPAIEFMFVASRRGGYIQHDAMADGDYVFIIDLPPGPAGASPYPIGNTDLVPHNTIVIRPRLLKSLRFLERIGGKAVDPVLEVLPPADPSKPPQQVRLTIPKGVLDGASAYGFKLALGWYDPARELARQVMLCEVDFRSLDMRLTDRDNPGAKMRKIFKDEEEDLKDLIFKELEKLEVPLPFVGNVKILTIPGLGDLVRLAVSRALAAFIDGLVGLLPTEAHEEWLFRVGVNGRWVTLFFEPGTDRNSKDRRSNPRRVFDNNQLRFKFAMAKGDELMIASHGLEFDPVGDIMHAAIKDRTIGFKDDPARPVPWALIVDPVSKAERDRMLFVLVRRMMFDTTEGPGKLSLGFDNSPLGLLDPDIEGNLGKVGENNPMIVETVLDPPEPVARRPKFARAIGPEMILVEEVSGGRPDYELAYTLSVKPQIADGGGSPA